MNSLLGKILLALLVFPPAYIITRFVKWSWRSFQKEMEESGNK